MQEDDELAHYIYEGELQTIRNAKLSEIERALSRSFNNRQSS